MNPSVHVLIPHPTAYGLRWISMCMYFRATGVAVVLKYMHIPQKD